MTDARAVPPRRGRPPRKTPAEIGAVALRLFAERGFEATTVDEIAAELGVARRTVFRSFPSKNDIVWGDFDLVLERLRADLDAQREEPVALAIRRAVISSNTYPPELLAELRTRIRLITTVPALQAHSALRYSAWRRVIAEYVALRTGGSPDDLGPVTLAHVALGVSIAAFSTWVSDPSLDLEAALRGAWESVGELGGALSGG
jgi:mycofactocin system transcriptional regulator